MCGLRQIPRPALLPYRCPVPPAGPWDHLGAAQQHAGCMSGCWRWTCNGPHQLPIHCSQAVLDGGKHTDAVSEVKTYYASFTVLDDLCLAAAWLALRCVARWQHAWVCNDALQPGARTGRAGADLLPAAAAVPHAHSPLWPAHAHTSHCRVAAPLLCQDRHARVP
jgi:hypothetical protein